MRRRYLAAGLTVLVVVAGLVGAPRAAHAGSATPAVTGPLVTLRESSKIVLGETSIDGPVFDLSGDINYIGWTGTDPAHHLNLMQETKSGSGYVFSHKQTLSETSIAHPAVNVIADTTPWVFVAWTGTDPAHTLNILCEGCPSPLGKLTLRGETSSAAPAVLLTQVGLMLAWTGTDPNHSLNVLLIGIETGQYVLGPKTTLPQFSSGAAPTLTYDRLIDTPYVLSWTTSATNRIDFAASSDGVHWQGLLASPLSETTTASLRMLAVETGIDIPHYYLTWTGTNAAHSVNVQYTFDFPTWPHPERTKFVLHESAIGGPDLVYDIQGGDGRRLFLIWTGTDSAHHLNFATIDM